MNDEELIKETMMLDYSQLVMHNVYMIKENKKLENIIKEVRKYIEPMVELDNDIMLKGKMLKPVLEILDKTN